MRRLSIEQIKAILEAHDKWLRNVEGGERANLSRANLSEANLSGADLSRANLKKSCLDPASPIPDIPDADITGAGMEIRGDRVYGWRTSKSQHVGSQEYKPRRNAYKAPVFSVSAETACHPGIYIAGKAWLEAQYSSKSLVRCWCYRRELVHAGDKWRCKRLLVIEGERRTT